jgi:hypothetical protein
MDGSRELLYTSDKKRLFLVTGLAGIAQVAL